MACLSEQRERDKFFMQKALKEAKRAFEQEEVPIGCVVVLNDRIIGRGYNQVEQLNDCTAHAEIIAITASCHSLQCKYLNDATIYVTMEPCIMCVGAIVWSRVKRLAFGCKDPKKGFLTGQSKIDKNFLQQLEIIFPLLEEESSSLVRNFFQIRR